MKKLIAFAAVLFFSVALAQPASAHVLVLDETKSVGAILHIVPDDDPIAGEKAEFYFDMPKRLVSDDTTILLFVTDEQGDEQQPPIVKDGSLVTASYVFPAQGLYTIRYTVTTQSQAYQFVQTQRVARGAATEAVASGTYAWPQALLVVSSVGFIVVGIVVFNRRHLIAKQSVL